ncbi:hypothetical protein HHL19_05990 [Streptomyces sp. R302]|uniref:hypothetical protein n=1 Tax=unclassified Streptomyces TaxID=2593676 RepID=UPI00145CDB08|nr:MULTISPECIES: hypothetical protein [unclassified Streptomyces]NML53273.1 hypothetical protein [Streptomyces sp. R301]NML78227.1 hypothetical protein [Streptomyces sp. R302]
MISILKTRRETPEKLIPARRLQTDYRQDPQKIENSRCFGQGVFPRDPLEPEARAAEASELEKLLGSQRQDVAAGRVPQNGQGPQRDLRRPQYSQEPMVTPAQCRFFSLETLDLVRHSPDLTDMIHSVTHKQQGVLVDRVRLVRRKLRPLVFLQPLGEGGADLSEPSSGRTTLE